MKKTVTCAVFVLIALIASTAAFAQEWTKAQKEVWQIVEDSWTKWKAGDVTGTTSCLHEKYQGWNDQIPLPLTREQVVNRFQEFKDREKVESFFLNPARIVITENAAVVDYFFSVESTLVTGEKKEQLNYHGQNVEFYIKEGGKWMLLGDMTTVKVEKD